MKPKRTTLRDADYSALPQPVTEMEDFDPVISEYTRAQAIDDGVLIDATSQARMMGIQFPVALTCAAWSACIDGLHVANPQLEEVRLLHVLRMLVIAAGQNEEGDTTLRFRVPPSCSAGCVLPGWSRSSCSCKAGWRIC